ncbi:MAG: tRNA epoxyqueuosine(34) reductase QueG [Lysobacterales bacterium]
MENTPDLNRPTLDAADGDVNTLARHIKVWGKELGFQQVGICDTDLASHETYLLRWLKLQRHGTMEYMQRHGTTRSRPADLVPGTLRVISVRMDYRTASRPLQSVLDNPDAAAVSRYALGRDYHKVMRRRLQKLADRISAVVGDFGYRAFVDSAPVLEKALAQKAGLGWIGKHSNVINEQAGSWFFLGELYTDLPLPVDPPAAEHCGTCRRCIDACPTDAIVGPFEVDARRCISYLTIELKGSIPEVFRKPMGNRIYGCDDCQLVCPWNKFAEDTEEPDFQPRHSLDDVTLVSLFAWSASEFDERTKGSPIRRVGFERWLRNIAVALGNATTSDEVINALQARAEDESPLVQEHVAWALKQHRDF